MVLLLLLAKWLHVLGVVAVVGLHTTYGVWIVRAMRDADALLFALRTIIALDNWLALPGFVALVSSGITMLAMTHIVPTNTPWLFAALVLFLALMLMHLFVYRPALRALIRLVEQEGVRGASFRASADRERNVGITMTVMMVAIAFLMVVKPRLWG